MWLLSTDRAELHYFNKPEDVPGGYAILSHVWQGKEQSFQEIQTLRTLHTSPEDPPRAHAHPKVRNCCILAARHGYRWIWDDTCCIDKTSSAELSEAINSMFMWYAKSDVCYAYLYDVPDIDRLDMTSPFYTSRWFTRGWTLQELIAPTAMVFVSQDWDVLGTKTELVHHLQAITGIDTDILLRRRDLVEVSIAQKMSWAASRVTTKVEDEAYCLMGIFGVNMPTIYGEGRAAFYRLQEEIMKLYSDQTIFAWGDPYGLPDILSRVQDHLDRGAELSDTSVRTEREFLLASRPEKFSSTAVLYVPTSVQTAIDTAKEACINSSSQLTFQVRLRNCPVRSDPH